MFAVLRTFAAKQSAVKRIGRIERTAWWIRILPLGATLTARMPEVTGVSEIFAGDGFEYITHGILGIWGLEAEPCEDGSTSSWITWPFGQRSISEFFTVNIKCGHDPNEDSALLDLSMLH